MYIIYVSILRELLKRENSSHRICFYDKRKKESPSVLHHAKKKKPNMSVRIASKTKSMLASFDV